MMHKTHEDGSFTLVALSSDDHIITGSTQAKIDSYHELLSSRYETKRLGFPSRYLGWTLTKFENGSTGISQPLLVDKLVEAMDMTNEKPASTPYISHQQLHSPEDGEPSASLSSTRFAEMVGYLRYLADSTRPDICYIISRLASANQRPTLRHYNVLRKVTRYLKRNKTAWYCFHTSVR